MDVEQERMMEEKQAKKRQKNLDKKQEMLAASAGANGEVAALDGVRFTGTFGVAFAPEQKMTKQQLRFARMNGTLMVTENDANAGPKSVGCLTSLSAKKQEGFEIARRNHLIKKSKKLEKQKVSPRLHLLPPAKQFCGRLCGALPSSTRAWAR